MKKKINISPLQIQNLVKKIIKEEAGKDTPGGNPDYYYDDDFKKMQQKYSEPGDPQYVEPEEEMDENSLLKAVPYKGGQLVLEYETVFGPPKYMIYLETGDLDSGDTTSDIVAELDPDFFDEQMATTILEYVKTRE